MFVFVGTKVRARTACAIRELVLLMTLKTDKWPNSYSLNDESVSASIASVKNDAYSLGWVDG